MCSKLKRGLGLPGVTHENIGQTRRAGGRKSPVGSRDKASMEGLEDVPQNFQKLDDICAL